MTTVILDFSTYRIIDLSLSYDDKVAGYKKKQAKSIAKDGWNASEIQLYSHAGTHMDAPVHFGVNDDTIDKFEVHQLMGKAWLVHIPIVKSQQSLTVEDLGDVAHKFESGDSLLLRTDWSQYISQAKYRNELPRISQALAEWCVKHQVKMLGVEPPSVADVNNLEEVSRIHQVLLGGEVIIIEGLTHLDKISKPEVILIALPLKIKEGDGAPARVIALEKKDKF